MGRQINFYMSEKVQTDFLAYLEQNQFVLLDYYSQIVEQPFSTNVYHMYLYKQEYGELVMRQGIQKMMDIIKSPVIEFWKTSVKKEEKEVLRGRLWISNRYYDEEGNMVEKKEIFIKDYQRLIRWIKKYVPYQVIAKGKHLIKEYVNDEVKELQEKGFILTM